MGKVGDFFGGLADEAEGAWDGATGHVGDAVGSVADVAGELVDAGHDVAGSVVEGAGDVLDGASDLASAGADVFSDGIASVAAEMPGLYEDVRKMGRDISDTIQETKDDILEFGKDFVVDGVFRGDFGEDSWGKVAGQIVVGLTPPGIIADVRDGIAAVQDFAEGKADWTDLLLAGIAFVPLFGDGIKGIYRLGRMMGKADDLAAAARGAGQADDLAGGAGDVVSGAGHGGGDVVGAGGRSADDVGQAAASAPRLHGNMNLNGDTAGTGGIRDIYGNRAPDGSTTITIHGELKPGMNRDAPTTPNYNDDVPALPGHHAAHLWGPGLGDEAKDGIMHAPVEMNLSFQKRVENRLSELQKAAADAGLPPITLKASAESYPVGTNPGYDMLKSASYKAEIHLPGEATPRTIFEADITVERSGKFTIETTPGSAEELLLATRPSAKGY